MEVKIRLYTTSSGKSPFNDWLDSIKDKVTSSKVLLRIDRLKLGNLGDSKSVGEGVFELRIHYGPGIRVYYGRVGNKIILLLNGGDKGGQNRDILKAKEYYQDFLSRETKNE